MPAYFSGICLVVFIRRLLRRNCWCFSLRLCHFYRLSFLSSFYTSPFRLLLTFYLPCNRLQLYFLFRMLLWQGVVFVNFLLICLCLTHILFYVGSVDRINSHGRISPAFFWFSFVVFCKLWQILQQTYNFLAIFFSVVILLFSVYKKSIL